MLDVIRIFLADDDDDDCMLFAEALNDLNINSELVVSKDGMHLMQTFDDNVPPIPVVLFLDINMPKKNGLECLKEIRQSDKLKNIPVVMFSTSMERAHIDRAHDYGANYYLRKPAKFEDLQNAIKKVLSMQILTETPTPKEQFLLLLD